MTTDLAVIEAALTAAKLPDDYNGWALVEPEGLRGAKFVVWVSKLATTAAWPPDGVCDRTSWITSVPLLDPSTAAELVERVKAAEAEVERLADWKASALPVMDGLQELGKSLGLPLGARITGPLAYVAAETLNARAETAEATIARVRELAESVPKTIAFNPSDAAYLSGQVDFAEAVLDALNHTDGISPESGTSGQRNRFTSANSAGVDETTLRARAEEPTEPILRPTDQRNWDRPEVALIRHMGGRTYARVGAHKWTELPKFGQVLVTEDLVAQQHEAIAVFIQPTDQRYEPPADRLGL